MRDDRPRPALPPCDCGAEAPGVDRGHAPRCAMVQAGLARRAAAPTAAPLVVKGDATGLDAVGRKKRGRRSVRQEVRGLPFDSLVEAEVFLELERRRATRPGAFVLVRPRFELWASWSPGLGRPQRFTPDFLLVAPRVVETRELEEHDDDVHGRVAGLWVDRTLALFDVEAHEAKPPRRPPRTAAQARRADLESRDYVVRLAAWRAAHPQVPFTRWSLEEGRLVELRLPPAGDGNLA